MAQQQTRNKEVIFASRPKDRPTENNFRLQDCDYPRLTKDGQAHAPPMHTIIVGSHFKLMTEVNSYTKPYEEGQPMYGDTIAKVIDSRNNNFNKGDYVMGMLNWRLFDVISPEMFKPRFVQKLDTKGLPLDVNLGLLGMTGWTAYFGLNHKGKPKQGETVVVSAATGAVGMVVGQLAKIKGCRVIGIAGGTEKVRVVKEEYGFDDCVDYKKAGDRLSDELKRACPEGIDLFWDGVGGPTLDAVLENLKVGGRVVSCGCISSYNNPQPIYKNWLFVAKRGLLVYDYFDRVEEARTELARLYKEGHIKYKTTISHGLEESVPTLLGLFEGKNVGKAIVEICKDTPSGAAGL
ncbi:oxidoreductase, zincbinding dehydrogenase superfamily protein [Acanthamoeba castellanii str. Neff]|uniref:Oxidoreductase, zincbinding dehydrogenase superfamily protein n=1 Tax=Acanthamoeba castellanii (strain ATCC 30010 / Neff) TaxID=1257118 RepID=L8GYF9_ACACF|nr:oxidoreductase, zincbinding dehydrogenase superfamily protein [Acanthamoeba castellanii str. Neff]ELR18025.1 oxidoreductase, zincbinding dehydrogenase superfamily protein [Acanthamoeba castellanii str. Neff]